MFKKSHVKSININLRNIILLHRQSTMELYCNPKLSGKIYKSIKQMLLLRNGVKMLITHKAYIVSHKPHVWFDQKYITNLISLKNIINKYRFTYEILYEIFIANIE